MAQNKTMAQKHMMAKRWAVKEMTESSKLEMCANIKHADKSVAWNINYRPYSILPMKKG